MANEITKVTDKNNVDHPLRDAAAQTALTGILNGQSIDSFGDVESALEGKFPRSEQAVFGAKNIFDYKNTPIDDYQATHSFITNGVNVVSSQSGNWCNSFYIFSNKYKNTDVKFSCDVDYVSGNFRLDIKGNNSTTPSGTELAYDSTTVDKHMELFFNTGDTAYIIIQLIVTDGTGGTGEANITNMMLRLASDTDDTYAPYAMTNKELTEKVNAIDVSSDITINTEQTAYNISSLRVQRIGQLVLVTGDITSLTEDAVPQGRSFVSIASLLPKPIIDTHMVIPPRGSGNQAELYIVGNNSGLQMRGGTVNQAYQFTFTYITSS